MYDFCEWPYILHPLECVFYHSKNLVSNYLCLEPEFLDWLSDVLLSILSVVDHLIGDMQVHLIWTLFFYFFMFSILLCCKNISINCTQNCRLTQLFYLRWYLLWRHVLAPCHWAILRPYTFLDHINQWIAVAKGSHKHKLTIKI
jgi:hypothetical protein